MNKNTQIIRVHDASSDRENIRLAAQTIRDGGLVAMPTETVYGIGADALNSQAVAKIFEAKGRPQDNPLIVHIAKIEDLDRLVTKVPENAKKLAERFWPGPLTMIMSRSELIPANVSAGLDTVAVRMPSHPVAHEIILECGRPVAAPSANLSGNPSPTSVQHCMADLAGRVDLIVDGGPSTVGIESTVVSLTGEMPRMLRPGGITLEALREVLGEVEVDPAVLHKIDESQKVSSPGMKYKHYAPHAKVVLVHGSFGAFAKFLDEHREEGTFALVFDEDKERLQFPCLSYGGKERPEEQARQLFAALRRLDEIGAKTVYARSPETVGLGLAVYNRLVRAAAFDERHLED